MRSSTRGSEARKCGVASVRARTGGSTGVVARFRGAVPLLPARSHQAAEGRGMCTCLGERVLYNMQHERCFGVRQSLTVVRRHWVVEVDAQAASATAACHLQAV